MIRRTSTSVLLAVLALLLLGGPAQAGARGADATYPPGPHAVLGVLSEQTILDGAEVVMSGDGFLGGSLLTVTLDGEPYSTLRAEAGGSFQITVRIRGAGTRLLAVSGKEPDGRQRIVRDPVTVVSASESPVPTASPDVRDPDREPQGQHLEHRHLPARRPGPGRAVRWDPAAPAGPQRPGMTSIAASTPAADLAPRPPERPLWELTLRRLPRRAGRGRGDHDEPGRPAAELR